MRDFANGTLAALLGATLSVAACHRAPAPTQSAATVIAQAVHSTTGADADGEMRYPAEVLPRYSTVVSFRVAGKIVERKVRLGDFVSKGEVLAELDAVDATRQAASSASALAAAEHRLVFAKQQMDRDTGQAAQDLIAANQLEQSQDDYAAALGTRDQAAAHYAISHNSLAYNKLVADRDGIITSENADTGQVVTAGQAVYGLAWSGDTDIVLDAAAKDLMELRPGQTADVNLAALPRRRFEARIREVSPAADAQSRTYRLRLTLLNPDPDVRIGMTGDAVFKATAHPGSFSIPAASIFHKGDRPAVWLIRRDNSLLELREIVVKHYSSGLVSVTSGLNDGDVIVAAGVHTVFAGEHVKPTAALFSTEPAAGQ